MKDSNFTLRFNRTAKDAFGHDIEFDSGHRKADVWVLCFVLFALGFVIGLMVGG